MLLPHCGARAWVGATVATRGKPPAAMAHGARLQRRVVVDLAVDDPAQGAVLGEQRLVAARALHSAVARVGGNDGEALVGDVVALAIAPHAAPVRAAVHDALHQLEDSLPAKSAGDA